MSTRRRTILFATVRLGVVYLLLCAVTPALSRWLTFPAPKTSTPGIPTGATLLEARTSDGTRARALRFDVPHAALTVVFFHGSGELAEDEMGLARVLVGHGYAAVFVEYRGYGLSADAGTTTERGIYADAEALLEASGAPRDHVVLYGFSLGTGVAVEMAARGWGRAMVLLAPYTSIPDVAFRRVPLLPMQWLVRDKLDSLSKAAGIDMPVLVAHGDADDAVPFEMGERLAHAFPHGRFVTVSGGHHTDLFARDDRLMQKVIDFLISVTPN
jgi:pimeloyl-ACP methyl ester carboxylesterase